MQNKGVLVLVTPAVNVCKPLGAASRRLAAPLPFVSRMTDPRGARQMNLCGWSLDAAMGESSAEATLLAAV
eukprot:6180559-Pleurochrysis_carterae.AAC.3